MKAVSGMGGSKVAWKTRWALSFNPGLGSALGMFLIMSIPGWTSEHSLEKNDGPPLNPRENEVVNHQSLHWFEGNWHQAPPFQMESLMVACRLSLRSPQGINFGAVPWSSLLHIRTMKIHSGATHAEIGFVTRPNEIREDPGTSSSRVESAFWLTFP